MTCQRTEQLPQPLDRRPHPGLQVPSPPTFRSHAAAAEGGGGDANDADWTSVDTDEVTPVSGDWPAGAMTSRDVVARRHRGGVLTTKNWHR